MSATMELPAGIIELLGAREPVVAEIYRALIAAIAENGAFQQDLKKTSVHLTHGTAFAGAHPARRWLDLNIRLDHPLPEGKTQRSERVSASRWHHLVRLESVADVNREVCGWVREAYALTSKRAVPR